MGSVIVRWAASARWRRVASAFVGVTLAFAVWGGLVVAQPAWLAALQDRGTDAAWRLVAEGTRFVVADPRAGERRLIVVDIDERSLREVGPWPWARATQARLIERLAQGGVSQQVLDVVFATARDGDVDLQRAISSHKPVLAQIFALPGQGDQTTGGQVGGALAGMACPRGATLASGYLANDPAITRTAEAVGAPIGHITPKLSDDGVVRSQPAFVCHENGVYPSLALATLMRTSGESALQLRPGEGLLGPAWTVQGVRGHMPAMPVGSNLEVRLPWWQASSAWISLSASDVLAGRVPAGWLQGAWVLVGSSAFGLNDTVATPLSASSSGFAVHAQLLTALLDGRVPYTPRGQVLLQGLALAASVLLLLAAVNWSRLPVPEGPVPMALSSGRLRSWLPLWGLACAIWFAALHVLALYWGGWVVGWLEPALGVIAGGLGWAIAEHTLSNFERDRLYQHLSSYLPAPVAAALAVQGPSSAVHASSRQVSVMFADIRNFSAYCESRPPEESAAVLHAFFSLASRIVQDEGGVIESLQGDSVMAVWDCVDTQGPAADLSLGAQRALRAAARLHTEVQAVLPSPAPAGLEPLALGIGLESGPAVAGSLGLASRRTHMVMGRTVTIANRLVGMTAELGYPILAGEGLATQTGLAELQSLGTFMLEGLRAPHHIYATRSFAMPSMASADVSFSARRDAPDTIDGPQESARVPMGAVKPQSPYKH